MKPYRPKAWQAVLVLAGFAPLLLDGCVSVDVSRSKPADTGAAVGSLEVIVLEKASDSKPTSSRVLTQLVRLESGAEQPVFESSDPTWARSDLPPGRYRLRVSEWIDEKGRLHRFAKSDQENFQVRAGERVQARVVLKGFPTGPVITAAVLAAVAIAIAAIASAFGGSSGMHLGKSRSHTETEREQRQKESLIKTIRGSR